MKSRFYILWLKVACVVTILVGLIAWSASTDTTSFLWLYLFDAIQWPIDGNPSSFQVESFALNAVLGGVMVGWGTLMYLLTAGPIAEGNLQILKYMLIALLVWFILDSAGSFVAKIPRNVVLNVGFLLLFIPPIIALLIRRKS